MTKGTVIRTVVLIVSLINTLLVANGVSPLPIDDAQIELLISVNTTVVVSLWTWWKNNSFTKKAIESDDYMKTLK